MDEEKVTYVFAGHVADVPHVHDASVVPHQAHGDGVFTHLRRHVLVDLDAQVPQHQQTWGVGLMVSVIYWWVESGARLAALRETSRLLKQNADVLRMTRRTSIECNVINQRNLNSCRRETLTCPIHKCKPHGGARGEVRGLIESLGIIICGAWMSEEDISQQPPRFRLTDVAY